MAQSLKSAIVENQRLQAQINLLKNASIALRKDIEDCIDEISGDMPDGSNISERVWNEFKACIEATPEYSTKAIAVAAAEDFARWQAENMRGIFGSFMAGIERVEAEAANKTQHNPDASPGNPNGDKLN